jgi:sulfur-oxidizing protein SoxX
MRRSMLQIHGELKPGRLVFATLVVLVLVQVNGLRAEQTMDQRLAAGKNLAMARGKGNCLACHAIADGELPGNIGPPLLYMRQRFPDKKDLRAQIWDPTVRNPDTVMPPFGKHRILTGEEIDLIVDYIQTL